MIEAYFNGVCDPNPGGVIGYGAVIFNDKEVIYEISKKIQLLPINSTNNVAAYISLIALLNYLKCKNFNENEIKIMGDSKLVINQMNNTWAIKDGVYKKYANLALERIKDFSDIQFSWIKGIENGKAQFLARNAYGF